MAAQTTEPNGVIGQVRGLSLNMADEKVT